MNESEVLTIEVDPGLPLSRVPVSLPMSPLKLLKSCPARQKSTPYLINIYTTPPNMSFMVFDELLGGVHGVDVVGGQTWTWPSMATLAQEQVKNWAREVERKF